MDINGWYMYNPQMATPRLFNILNFHPGLSVGKPSTPSSSQSFFAPAEVQSTSATKMLSCPA